MSNASRRGGDPAPAPPRSLRAAVQRSVLAPLRFLAFWAAVLLPLAYLPLLHGGLTATETTVLVGLVAVNALALRLGHGHASAS